MKTLYMVRHAKSSWKHDVIDHLRPLKGRGNRDGALVSAHLANILTPPQIIVSSDAVRAKTTAEYFRQAFKITERDFHVNPNLYDFSGHAVIDSIKGLEDVYDRVMIVGHNHAFTSIANMLGNTYIDNVPTCGFVHIDFDEDSWSKITTGKTVQTLFPRDLKE